MTNYLKFLFSSSLLALVQRAQSYQIAFSGWDETTEIPWENAPFAVNKVDPPCMELPDEDVMDVWVRTTTSPPEREIPPYIVLYGMSGVPTDPPCKGDKILHVFAYYNEPNKMQSTRTTLPSYTRFWREIYPDFMPDDPATQLIDGAGLEPGEVLNLDLGTMVYIKPDYRVTVHGYDSVPTLSSEGSDDYSEDELDDWSAGHGSYGGGYDFLSQMSSPRGQ
ncbi:hypothetical protein TWF569_006136 [Orbilia oligospora]|nr:hypothetical protein TWF706_001871 [Orbilia oligospora]KAF3110535.1 hypothetical protein TWF102_008113 [Orbilia oligospora]KAF3114866.1 hypothetical protein TWF103_000586 [Orbilia oligospora]KAF3147041.1 hypothetical protein TWF569_006136 [Orbilia oligospora]